jgi:hypothetical protein
LLHDTYFDEFIILSGDADFTPVLIRLRAHARRTVVFANDFTAAPYTAICDGEVREPALIDLILAGDAPDGPPREEAGAQGKGPADAKIEEVRREILAEVIAGVRASAAPVPLEALADRALRALGHERTIATAWAGAGSFRELLRRSLPDEIKITAEPPYLVFDVKRHREERLVRLGPDSDKAATLATRVDPIAEPPPLHTMTESAPGGSVARAETDPERDAEARASLRHAQPIRAEASQRAEPAAAASAPPREAIAMPSPQAAPPPQRLDSPSPIQQTIARIQEACQAPPLAPQEYRALFEIMAKEINDNDLLGVQTLNTITQRAYERGIDLRRDDVRFVLEVVSEADPWFEQGASADLFASRFRTFVVARCRGQGLNLSTDELDLIDAWFLGTGLAQRLALRGSSGRATPAIAAPTTPPARVRTLEEEGRQWSSEEIHAHRQRLREALSGAAQALGQVGVQDADDVPRAMRTRLRG